MSTITADEQRILDEVERGFDEDQAHTNGKTGTLGLAGIRERVRMLGGALDLRTAPGEGTTLRAMIPSSTADK